MTTLDGAVDLARDRELVERCQTGDESAFAELYDRYHRRLLRFCLRRLHSQDDAEEAVQEAFTRAWRALPQFGGDRRFYPWLTVIAGNVCTDALRRRARVVPMKEMPRQAVELDSEDLDAQLLRQVDLAMATEAFTHLSDRHQRVLRLRESTEWSAQRIAEFEGVAVPAVDTLLWRARQAFKREFALLSDAGGLAAVLGVGIAATRRGLARVWLRAAALAPAPMRSPGAIAATVALTGAAIAGGSVALVGSGPGHEGPSAASASSASSRMPSAAASDRNASRTGSGADAKPGDRASGGGRSTTGRGGGSAGDAAGTGQVTGLAGARPGTLGGSLPATPLAALFSSVGGLGGLGGTSTSSGSASTPVTTVTNTAGGVTGAVTSAVTSVTGTVTSVTGALTSATGASGTGTSTSGTTGTVVQTLVTSSVPLTAPTSGGSTSGVSGAGTLLAGL